MRAIGLMSGTSLDGVDAALLDTDGEGIAALGPTLFRPYTGPERDMLRAALAAGSLLHDRAARPGVVGEAEAFVTAAHAEAVERLLDAERIDRTTIAVVGFHGQTIFHAPERRLTIQIGDGAALAERLGLPVVHDFRAADVAAGGQGAPLVPLYHAALVRRSRLDRPAAVLNLGGVGNVTVVGAGDTDLVAFDTGPGNALLDDFVQARTGAPFDDGGRLAASGRVHAAALAALLAHPFFGRPPPKSLDRQAFDPSPVAALTDADGAATLTAFTAESVARATLHLPAHPRTWVVVGGGSHNPTMLAGIGAALARIGASAPIVTGDSLGWRAAFVEAEAFAFLAVRSLRGLPITLPGTTGAAVPLRGGRLARLQAGSNQSGGPTFSRA